MNSPSGVNSPELELYGARTGNCLRAAIGLEEAGLAYVVRHVNLAEGAQRAPSHLAMNPAGKVPVLIVRTPSAPEFVLTQSNAMLFYADERSSGRLLPAGGPPRARVLEAFFYFVTDVIALNGAAFILQRQQLAEASGKLTDQYLTALHSCELFLSEAGFMGGERFSIADIAAYTLITAVSARLPWDRLPQLAAWAGRIGERPGVKRGMAAFG